MQLIVITFSLVNFTQPRHKLLTEVSCDNVNSVLVNYQGLLYNLRFKEYISQLEAASPSNFKSREDSLAFWINV
ncbi:hypothetical protein BMS3Abin04_00568 [bacterium BMS3Abin04]|nr:hypothetical protein BMS3Abin04_00568 [bacterium BMS3Abin04]